MTPDEHAAEAERVFGTSDWLNEPRDADSLMIAVGALVHAVLSLRPAQPATSAPVLLVDRGGDLWIEDPESPGDVREVWTSTHPRDAIEASQGPLTPWRAS